MGGLFGAFSGGFGFVVVSFLLVRLGISPVEALVFGGFSGLMAGVFVYHERKLMRQLEEIRRDRAGRLAMLDQRIECLYANSSGPLVRIDGSTFLVEEASPGFFDILKLDAGAEIKGHSLEALLGTDPAVVRAMMVTIKKGDAGRHQILNCRLKDGETLEVSATGVYLSYEDAVEIILRPILKDKGATNDSPGLSADLERFRKGMVRRENRVLELKGEVNVLLKASGEPPRYRVDDKTSDNVLARIGPQAESGVPND